MSATLATTTRPDNGTLTDLRVALATDAQTGSVTPTKLRHLVDDTNPLDMGPITTNPGALHAADHQLALPRGTSSPWFRATAAAPGIPVPRPKAGGQ